MAIQRPFRRAPIASALLCLGTASLAQTSAPSPALPTVTVQEAAPASTAGITGFGNQPLARTPLQATVLGDAELKDLGATTLRALIAVDASVGDAYNAEGYWDQFTVRGFVLDNAGNYRRDGLPINAETTLPMANKSKLELLKGISGMQAGVSAPGGLVNLIVKRPDGDIRSVTVGVRTSGTFGASVDLGARFGVDKAFGLRFNAEATHLDPPFRDGSGSRTLGALAGDWRIGPSTLLEAEVETSRQAQRAQPGFSLLGNRVPDARTIDPRINLNDQAWAQPGVFTGQTGSLRWTQQLGSGWQARVHAGTQRLKSDDRTAFPFGCSAEGAYDRYCSDGSFDVYDYRSDNERRDTTAVDASLSGALTTGPFAHAVTVGVLRSRFTARFGGQAYNYVGTGTLDGTAVTPADPTPNADNTNRGQRSTELYARDQVQLTDTAALWLGLRHSRLQRESITTSGTEATDYSQSFTTPWIAASVQLERVGLLYASWGQGIESAVAPARPTYVNAGQPLAPLKSRQTEIGLKHGGDTASAGIAVFDIERPATNDIGECSDADASCRFANDGVAHHTGLELNGQARLGPWLLGASAMWLHARREGSADDSVDGLRPTNVPAHTLRLLARRDFSGGLSADAVFAAEGNRQLLPNDASLRIPGWGRLDLGARLEQRAGAATFTWRAGLDNALDRRAWRESPYEFGHVYLYPMAPRTWRLSLTADL